MVWFSWTFCGARTTKDKARLSTGNLIFLKREGVYKYHVHRAALGGLDNFARKETGPLLGDPQGECQGRLSFHPALQHYDCWQASIFKSLFLPAKHLNSKVVFHRMYSECPSSAANSPRKFNRATGSITRRQRHRLEYLVEPRERNTSSAIGQRTRRPLTQPWYASRWRR